MPKGLVNDSSLRDLADAIIAVTGHNVPMLPSEMAERIEGIHAYTVEDQGKVVDDGSLVSQTSVSIVANGTYDTTLNNQAVVNVPNNYTIEDEGKVVSNAALVSQTSVTKTENGTYDTTLNNQVIVAVPDYDTEEW